MGDKHHGHPIVSGVTRNLFRATAGYIFQNFSRSCCTFLGHTLVVCRVQRKKISGNSLKNDTASHLRAIHFTSVHAVFPAVVYKNGKRILPISGFEFVVILCSMVVFYILKNVIN